jgi:hypothetical protein
VVGWSIYARRRDRGGCPLLVRLATLDEPRARPERERRWQHALDFVRILNEQTVEKPFDIDDADVSSNATKLLTALGGPKGGATERAQRG